MVILAHGDPQEIAKFLKRCKENNVVTDIVGPNPIDVMEWELPRDVVSFCMEPKCKKR